MERDRNTETELGTSDSKGHEPCETIAAQGTTWHMLIKSRADSKFVPLQAGIVAPGNQPAMWVHVLSKTDKGAFTVPLWTAHKWILVEHFFGLFQISLNLFLQELVWHFLWRSPEGFIKYYIWRNCERDHQEALIFKIKVHTYIGIALQSLLLPPAPEWHEDFALPQ